MQEGHGATPRGQGTPRRVPQIAFGVVIIFFLVGRPHWRRDAAAPERVAADARCESVVMEYSAALETSRRVYRAFYQPCFELTGVCSYAYYWADGLGFGQWLYPGSCWARLAKGRCSMAPSEMTALISLPYFNLKARGSQDGGRPVLLVKYLACRNNHVFIVSQRGKKRILSSRPFREIK